MMSGEASPMCVVAVKSSCQSSSLALSDEEEEDVHALALRTFYSQEDEYSSLHRQFFRTDGKGRQQMNQEGLRWRRGRWSVQEVRLLRRNIRAFVMEHNVLDMASLLLEKDRSQHRALYQYIAKGIQRPLFSIYRKALRVLNVQNYVGKWTEDMDRELLRLHAVHGNKWGEIGRHMAISGQAVYDRFRNIHPKSNRGAWTALEEQTLSSAVAELQGKGGELDDLPEDAHWKDVADKVGSRTAKQCRQKWVLHLSCSSSVGGSGAQWSVRDDLKLLQTLVALEVQDEEEVDWRGECTGWPEARNGSFLRLRWAALRRSVPHYQVQTFQENLDYLTTHKLPALEQRFL